MLTFDMYQAEAMRTANPNTDEGAKLINAVLGLAGESGEVADHVKKFLYQGHELDIEKLIKEAGDILWYIALLSQALGRNMDYIAQENIMKLRKRYPDGFSTEKSINRNE